MKYSVIVPVYNVEAYLTECVNSVLKQTYGNFELILVDDGSVDSSGVLCDEFAKKDDRIKVYHKQNGGQLHARCFGIKKATGDYYVFLDSDDFLESDALNTLRLVIEKTESDCVIYGVAVDRNGKKSPFGENVSEMLVLDNKRDFYRIVFSSQSYNPLWRKAFAAKTFTVTDYEGYYHIRHGEDLLQSLDALKNCKRVTFIPDVLYNYRVNKKSVTHTIYLDNYKTEFIVRERVKQFIENENVYEYNDYVEYKLFAIQAMLDRINIIADLKAPVKTRYKLFDEVRATDYFRNYIRSDEYSDV